VPSPRDPYFNYRPNPNLIPIPSTAPPRFVPQLTNKRAGKLFGLHQHRAFIDKDGNGTTDVVDSHFHRVRDGRVLPDESDGHTHNLTGLPAGAG
jgi:hypothetical protein